MTQPLSQFEHELEDWACARFASLGCVCLKLHTPGFSGIPDRLLLTPAGRLIFLEFKAPGQKPRRTQPRVLAMLRAMRFRALVIDTRAQVLALLREVEAFRPETA